MSRETGPRCGRPSRTFILHVCLLLILFTGIAVDPAQAQAPTIIQAFTLTEFGFAPRTGTWIVYRYPGIAPFLPTPGPPPPPLGLVDDLVVPWIFPFPAASGVPVSPFFPPPNQNLGNAFQVTGICDPGPSGFSGGVFRGEGQGFGDLVALTLSWPFLNGQTLPGRTLNLCDPDADLTAWFAYGNSLNNSPLLARRFWGRDAVPVSTSGLPGALPTCSEADRQIIFPEGVFLFGLRSADRQAFDVGCQATDPDYPIRVGNVLICARAFPWLDPAGVNIPDQSVSSCEFYATCSNQTIGPIINPRPLPCSGNMTTGPFTLVPAAVAAPPGSFGASDSGGGVGPTPGGGSGGTVTVLVNNAANGNPIPGATVTQVGGATQATGADGRATFANVPAGAPVGFTASAPGFVTASTTTTPVANGSVPITIALTTPVAGGRVVLTWGPQPRDLDAHLTGPDGSGGRFHVYYGNLRSAAGATLDHDEQQGNGPETVTVTALHPGVYRYSVHHFAGTETICSTANQISVTVTVGAQQAQTFHPPAGGCVGAENNVWVVFEFDGANVIPRNTFYSSSAGGVQKAGSREDGDVTRLGALPPK